MAVQMAVMDDPLLNAARSSPLLGSLPAPDLTHLLEQGRGVHAPRGGVLRRESDDASLVLLRGAAIAKRTIVGGSDLVDGLLGPGDQVGLVGVLGHPDTAASVVALARSDAILLPGGALRRAAEKRHAVALACLIESTASLARARREAALFAATSTVQRVQLRLLQLVERFGAAERDRVRILVPLTQEDLAAWAWVSRESVAKALQQLRRAGIVETGRRELTVLDARALRARVDGDDLDATVRQLLRALG